MVSASGPDGTAQPQTGTQETGVVSRSSAEVIIRRALEKAQRDDTVTEEVLDITTLTAIASEVGLSASSVAEALAESRAGVDGEPSLIDRVVGPKVLWSTRPMAVTEETARERLVDWLHANHGLRSRVRGDGVVVAVKREDVAGKLGEGLRKIQGMGGLSQSAGVQAATASAADDEQSVCLAVDVGNKRMEAVAGGSAVAVVGTVAVGATAVVAGPLMLIALPVGLAAGAVTSRLVHRQTVKRFTMSLEETMDGVARGDRAPHPLDPLKKQRNRRR